VWLGNKIQQREDVTMARSIDRYQPEDPFFGTPCIDEDEQRTEPLPHRYLHGGFEGTDTRFSLYFPPAQEWKGRMVQTFGGATGGDERSASTIGAILNAHHNAFSNGAYLVESNQGHLGPSMEGLNGDMTILHGRADVETAKFSHWIAEEIYGSRPHHSYCYGGSGGGNFTLWAMERAPELYDGGVPFMFGGSSFSLTLNAVRLLEPVIDGVIDAMAPGGSQDPFEGLNTLQREALAALYRGGFQRGGEHQLRLPMPEITWPGVRGIEAMRSMDPSYFDAFWTEPGYAGADGVLDEEVIHEKSTISAVVNSEDISVSGADGFVAQMLALMVSPEKPLGIRIEGASGARLTGAKVTVESGSGAGRSWYCFIVVDSVLVPAGEGSFFDPGLVEQLGPGDAVTIDNREFLAYCYSDRHYARDPLSSAQFTVSGTPVYPRRAEPPNTLSWTGVFGGKMILQQHLMDRPCWPPVAIRYRDTVRERLGDAENQSFRIWWTDHAQHGPAPRDTPAARYSIDYTGLVSQGLRDVIRWSEEGISPAPSSSFEYVDGQVVLPPTADDRGGIQPVVRASANGGDAAHVSAGDPVELAFTAEVPEGSGSIVAAAWDLDGTGHFATHVEGIDGTKRALVASITHSFPRSGRYFATVRVASHRDGEASTPTERIENLARVRIVVS
jgi:hypothetical protein